MRFVDPALAAPAHGRVFRPVATVPVHEHVIGVIQMETFLPFHALGGGLLMGSAVAILLLVNGRLATVSGMLGGLMRGPLSSAGPRLAFVGGIIIGALACQMAGFSELQILDIPLVVLAAGGLLIGYGSRLAGGCLTGHGLCGVARFSLRSVAAVILFLGVAVGVVYLLKYVIGGLA